MVKVRSTSPLVSGYETLSDESLDIEGLYKLFQLSP